MGEQKIGVETQTVEDCRQLLAEGKISEGLEALEALTIADPGNASIHHYLAVALHLAGRSGESLQHFQRAHEIEPDQATVYQNQAIALLTSGNADAAASAAKRALELRPDGIGAYVNLVLAQIKLKQYDDAEQTLIRGLALDPNHVGLLTQAGHLAIELRKWEDAGTFVAAALRLAPENIDARYNAGVLFHNLGEDEKAIAEFGFVLGRKPQHQACFVNLGVSLRNLGRVQEAIRHFEQGLGVWPDWNVLRYNLAITKLFAGQWREAWAGYELRSEVAGSLDRSPRPDSPRWDGGDIRGKTLLVIHEQGFGDTFQFIRYLTVALAKAGKVIFVCQKRLFGLLSRIELFSKETVTLVSDESALPPHDCHVPLMSLPGLAQAAQDFVPPGIVTLSMESARIARWKTLESASGRQPKLWRIGLSWQGNPKAGVDRARSIPLADLAPLARIADKVQFISLQKHFGLDQEAPEGLDLLIPHDEFDAGENAFIDTAALMTSLDLIITSDTAVAHLAGMLGRPVWLFLKRAPDWRWGPSGHITPWYPTMRIFRQRDGGDWKPLFVEAAEDLDRMIVVPEDQSKVASTRIAEAVQFHVAGRFKRAIEIYDAALGSCRNDPQFLNFYAMALLEDGGRSRLAARIALPFACHSVALRPGNGDLWSNLAVLLDSMGSRQDSKLALRFGLTVHPGHVPSLISLAKKESADGHVEKALDILKGVAAREPNSANVLTALGSVYSDAGRHAEAALEMRRAIEIEPDNGKLWVQLGAIQSAAGRHPESAESWERAIFHDPKNPDAYSNLGVYERNYGELELSVYLQRRAVECDPQHAEGWNNLGIAELEAQRDELAIAAFRRALTVRPGYPDAHLALGMALLNGGDFDQGLQHYEWRLKADKLGITINRPKIPLWTGGDPKGLSFFLMAEQGFGDAFQFSRYAIWLKDRGAAKVYIGCRSQIAHLLRTIPGVDEVFGDGAKLPKADALVYMMSMPALSGMRLATIPAHESYMTADPERVTKWAEWLARKPGFRVGVVWQGNPDPKVDKGRSYPLAALEPLAKIAGVRLIALQKGKGEEQIEALDGLFEVETPGAEFDTGSEAFADTAAMMMNLDLVVTSDTAVAHLAGGLGRPCWVVLKSHPEWRWLTERSDSPWYPNTRLFRRVRDEIEDKPFDAVMARMATALGKLVDGDLSQRHVSAPVGEVAVKPFDPVMVFNRGLDAQRVSDSRAATAAFAEALVADKLRPSALNMLGVIALQGEKNHRAAVLFREAEMAGLSTSEFLTNYSISLRRTGRIAQAITYLTKAIDQKPTAEAHLSLGNIFRDECRFDEAYENYSKAIAMRPDMAKAHRGMGNLMRDMHRPKESLAAFEKARELEPGDPDLVLDHAHAKLFDGDFPGGFLDYEARWKSREMRPRTFPVPRWDATPMADKTLLLHGEQGFGDNIQFVRFVGEAAKRVGKLKLEVRGPLISLFRTLKTSVPVEIVEQGLDVGPYDCEVPMLSLPRLFGTTVDTVPPPAVFDIDPVRIGYWKARFSSPALKVGLIWQGNPKARADQGRSPPLPVLEPLFAVPGVEFVSLQKSDGLDQIAANPFAANMVVPGKDLGDFHETAAAILALDLVISSCTATLHLAATLGVPVFGMLKYHADWRWLNEREDSPWYPSLRLFQQEKVLDWESVVEPLRDALAERAEAHGA